MWGRGGGGDSEGRGRGREEAQLSHLHEGDNRRRRRRFAVGGDLVLVLCKPAVEVVGLPPSVRPGAAMDARHLALR
eukprot:741471-Hanusia_phi.AAC.1